MSEIKIFVYGTSETSKNYHAAVINSGMTPVYSLEPVYAAKICDALLLTGGGDVSPSLYGEENEFCVGIDDERDRKECALLTAFDEASKPIFGICRGLQTINVFYGGSLQQDIGYEKCSKHKYIEGVGDNVHEITSVNGMFLSPLFGTHFSVNSAHHQAIKVLAQDFCVAAVSNDNLIEAIEHTEKQIFALQWHPERMTGRHLRSDTVDGKVFFDFMKSLILSNKKDKE